MCLVLHNSFSGVLTGKYKRDEKLDHTSGRIAFVAKDESKAMQAAPAWSQYANNESYWSLIKTMEEIGKAHEKSVAQVALRWTLQKDVVASVIIGATSIKQLEDNMAVGSGWSLTKEEMEKLDQISIPDIPYPYEMSWRSNATRVNRYNPRPFVANKESATTGQDENVNSMSRKRTTGQDENVNSMSRKRAPLQVRMRTLKESATTGQDENVNSMSRKRAPLQVRMRTLTRCLERERHYRSG
ncbi:unnamed protein product [Mytilus edulis]|uniref:NADP-dependent oxidoreductase domain-containing protein n=1 Tax=Mytilus edulis TaxID=6550 RepID=A0A8S3R9T9_MYTED|nr:unnamed protein product [Mytilus edulis]